ncbi:hypothetical protein DFH09DRAFT_1081117 [Mycena vulgaris]|nr:hypothetical protein DFH09DRAFT_1081117 [Mycena vulgaris]
MDGEDLVVVQGHIKSSETEEEARFRQQYLERYPLRVIHYLSALKPVLEKDSDKARTKAHNISRRIKQNDKADRDKPGPTWLGQSQCSICSDKGRRPNVILTCNCRHSAYHLACISQWHITKGSNRLVPCPTCRELGKPINIAWVQRVNDEHKKDAKTSHMRERQWQKADPILKAKERKRKDARKAAKAAMKLDLVRHLRQHLLQVVGRSMVCPFLERSEISTDSHKIKESARSAAHMKAKALELQSVELRMKEAAERWNLEEQTEGLRRKTETLEGRYVALRSEESAAANGKRELAEQTEVLRQKAEALDERDLELQSKEGLLIKAQRSVDGDMENFRNKAAILKEQYIQMRQREDAFAKYRQSVKEQMDKFEQDTEKLLVDAKAKAKDLQTQFGEAIEENAALHRTLEERNLEISEKTDVISSLFRAKQMLEQNLRALQAQPGHTQELEQRRARENALQAELSDFTKHFDVNKAELEALQKKLETSEADATVTSAAHARAEDNMRGLHAEKAETDQRLRAKELELIATSVRESELLAALDAERMRAAADQKQSEEKIVMLQAELEALRAEADHKNTEYKAAKGALEARVVALRTQRKQSDSKVSELEEDLRAAAKASDNSISKLKDNLKQRMLQISELKKKIEQHNTKAKAEVGTVRVPLPIREQRLAFVPQQNPISTQLLAVSAVDASTAHAYRAFTVVAHVRLAGSLTYSRRGRVRVERSNVQTTMQLGALHSNNTLDIGRDYSGAAPHRSLMTRPRRNGFFFCLGGPTLSIARLRRHGSWDDIVDSPIRSTRRPFTFDTLRATGGEKVKVHGDRGASREQYIREDAGLDMFWGIVYFLSSYNSE